MTMTDTRFVQINQRAVSQAQSMTERLVHALHLPSAEKCVLLDRFLTQERCALAFLLLRKKHSIDAAIGKQKMRQRKILKKSSRINATTMDTEFVQQSTAGAHQAHFMMIQLVNAFLKSSA